MTAEQGPVLVQPVVDAPEPAEALSRLAGLPWVLLLESAQRTARLGRYSFLTADPFVRLRSRGSQVEEAGPEGTRRWQGDPFEALRAALARYPLAAAPGLPPFQGGAAGYLAYDLARQLERLPARARDDLAMPDLCVGLYDWTLAWDHERGRCWLICTGLPAHGAERRRHADARAASVHALLQGAAPAPPPAPRPASAAPAPHPVPGIPGVRSTLSRAAYLDVVERTRELIRAGDIFQANISQRLEAELPCPPVELYRRLRAHNPAPFAAYFDAGEGVVVSSSPERFLQLRDGQVETRPIKGTAARGLDPLHDAEAADALRRSDKDRAENVMIVDLLRNDLSRVCEDDSVAVPELCVVESYARVHHLVSTVVGRLRPECGPVDLLRAAFPGGSITGAPKVRAMEIIDELEPTRRGVYTGALGYLGFNGTMDTSIVIRTFVVRDGRVYFQAGGGIVADSDPDREYQETLDKARGLVAALEVG